MMYKISNSRIVNCNNYILWYSDPPESWTGNWLPERVTESLAPSNQDSSKNHDTQRMLSDISEICDDGKVGVFFESLNCSTHKAIVLCVFAQLT